MKGNRKKILIATGIYPPDIGGPATIVGELKNSLSARGYNVKVITYSSGSESNDQVIRIDKNKRLAKFTYLLALLKMSFSADVIYATDTYSVGYFAYLLKKIFRKPYIIRFAGDSAWETAFGNNWTSDYILDFQKKIYDERIEQLKARRTRILQSADKIIAVSEFMSDVAQAVGVNKDKIKVIYNSVDFERAGLISKDGLFKKYNLQITDRLVMTACRLTPWKGVDGLIKAVKDLRQKFPVKLMILGSGPELEKLHALRDSLGMQDAVIFTGVIRQEEMISYLGCADVFILNTYYEGLSHTLLEAVRARVPIIASNAGGNSEVIQNNINGILIDYNNETQIKEAIEYIFTHHERAMAFVESAAAQSDKFSWSKVVENTINVINEIK